MIIKFIPKIKPERMEQNIVKKKQRLKGSSGWAKMMYKFI